MAHSHRYDAQGKQLCCTQEEKINSSAEALIMRKTAEVGNGPSARQNRVASDHKTHEHADDDGHDHSDGGGSIVTMFLPAAASLLALLIALGLDNYFPQSWFTG